MKTKLSLSDIYAPIQTSVDRIPRTILDILETSNELATDVIQYFFSGQGKLLRPAFTLLGAEVTQPGLFSRSEYSTREAVTRLAASYEIFHAATLIHDDIIDAAYIRRNIPTINAKWNEQTAVLVGDFLHDKALGQIYEYGTGTIFKRFLETAGTVCDGEIHELHMKGNFALSEKEYYDIINKKTAALLACCIEAGSMAANGSRDQSEALKRFGYYFGLAFQIVDDCLDFTGNEHEFGKTLGTDCMAGVLTLPLIRLLELVDPVKKDEISTIFKSEGDSQKLKKLLEMIREYETVEYSLEKACEFNDKARLELAVFQDSPAKQSLMKLLDYVLERNR